MTTKRKEPGGGKPGAGSDTSYGNDRGTGAAGDASQTGPAKKGDWVQIHSILLSPEERSASLPEDTKKVPLEMWVNGFLVYERAEPGDEVEVATAIGRRVRGRLSSTRPGYFHSFGETLPELQKIGRQLRMIVRSGTAADARQSEAADDSSGDAPEGGRA